MLEFKIETDALNKRREAKGRLLSWGIVLLLFAMTVSIYALGFLGLLSAGSDLRWLAWLSVPAILGAVIGASILACREALRRAEREMVFVLDDNGIVRRRKGFPEVRIAFSEVDTLGEELRWLVVKSTEPRRKIAIPNNVKGFDVIRAELTKHHALSAQFKKLPLKSAAPMTISVLKLGCSSMVSRCEGCHPRWGHSDDASCVRISSPVDSAASRAKTIVFVGLP